MDFLKNSILFRESPLDLETIKNFIFLKDDKKKTMIDLDEDYIDEIIKYRKEYSDSDSDSDVLFKESVELLYSTHLDFAIKNEKVFKTYFFEDEKYGKDILTDYLRYRKSFTEAEQFIEALLFHENNSFSLSKLIEENKEEDKKEEENKEEEEKMEIFDLYSDSPLEETQVYNLKNKSNSLNDFIVNDGSISNETKKAETLKKSGSIDNLSTQNSLRNSFNNLSTSKSLKNSLNNLTIGKRNMMNSMGSIRRNLKMGVDTILASDDLNNKNERPSSIAKIKTVVNYFQIPKKSIFAKISPVNFAESLHKLSTYLFFLFSTRELEYVSRVEGRTYTNKYNKLYSNVFPNLFPLFENEIEMYCESKNLKMLYEKLSLCLETFLKLNNLPMARVFITIMSEFKICNESFSVIKFEETLKNLTKNDNLYFGFAPEYSLKTKFVGIFSKDITKEQKLKNLSSNINSITKTKIRLMEEIKRKTTVEDIITFEFLKVQTKINEKLYKHVHRSGRILCLVETCENK